MTARTTTELDTVADRYVDDLAEFSPSFAIDLGRPLPSRAIEDFSAEGQAQWLDLIERVQREVDATTPVDHIDEVTTEALIQSLNIEQALLEAGEYLGELNNIASPVQSIRDGFTMMPQETAAQWDDIVRRVEAVASAYDEYRSALIDASERGRFPTRVQVQAVIHDLGQQVSNNNPFERMIDDLEQTEHAPEFLDRLRSATHQATGATRKFQAWLAETIAPQAINEDAVGRERYLLHSAQFLGTRIDPDDTYAWAEEELARIHTEQQTIVNDLYGEGTSVHEALKRLNDDPTYQVHGIAALKKWMQETSDRAVEDLAGEHFTVTDDMRALECMISPAGDGGIFYTAPSDDFSRPGRMWWAVPPGQEIFHTWQEKTTVYHEGMPGHHMQLSRAVAQKDTLNSWRRNACWFSGHGEGWALYAEDLMDHLGYLSDPAERLGMLDAQRLRAARILVDIGVHLAKERPSRTYLDRIGVSEEAYSTALSNSPYADLGASSAKEGIWDRNDVWAFMATNVAMLPAFLQFETTRYLGWPAQASSYKVGQREWERARDDYLATNSGATLRDFHDEALGHGGLPLSALRTALRLS
ncbi:MAG: DUF885 domain-containing protein [Actinomycetaceae bacterium]|nr:DUF885 domain-containing protein [Actinomycetaceae bacterium]